MKGRRIPHHMPEGQAFLQASASLALDHRRPNAGNFPEIRSKRRLRHPPPLKISPSRVRAMSSQYALRRHVKPEEIQRNAIPIPVIAGILGFLEQFAGRSTIPVRSCRSRPIRPIKPPHCAMIFSFWFSIFQGVSSPPGELFEMLSPPCFGRQGGNSGRSGFFPLPSAVRRNLTFGPIPLS